MTSIFFLILPIGVLLYAFSQQMITTTVFISACHISSRTHSQHTNPYAYEQLKNKHLQIKILNHKEIAFLYNPLKLLQCISISKPKKHSNKKTA